MADSPINPKFLKQNYNFNVIGDRLRMTGVLRHSLAQAREQKGDPDFCAQFAAFVDDDDIWPLAQMQAPEFRFPIEQQ